MMLIYFVLEVVERCLDLMKEWNFKQKFSWFEIYVELCIYEVVICSYILPNAIIGKEYVCIYMVGLVMEVSYFLQSC